MENNSNLQQEVVDFISNHHSLTKSSLCYNNIGKEGAIAISEALKHNHSITYIDLSYGNFDDEDTMTVIEDQLKRNLQIPYVFVELLLSYILFALVCKYHLL